MNYIHQPVLVNEVLEYLNPQSNQNFIDCTVGGGGHAQAILEKTSPNGKLLGLDLDPAAIEATQKNLAKFNKRISLVQDSYKNIDQILCGQRSFLQPSGILLDLGISSYQVSALDQRGFSFQKDALLDMRFGPSQDLTAAEVLNNYSEKKLAEIFRQFGEEPYARKIAEQIILFRKENKIKTTLDLVQIVKRVKSRHLPGGIHPATKVFQALRIEVNQELEVLAEALPKLVGLMPSGARLAVISFHSLEDRIVKQFFNQESLGCICPKQIPVCRCNHQKSIKIINKKVVMPSGEEIRQNSRSRSAKLRVIEKIVTSN